jgi:hypothetical protein
MLTLLGSAVDSVLDGLHFSRSLWDLGFVLLRSLQSIRRWFDDTICDIYVAKTLLTRLDRGESVRC